MIEVTAEMVNAFAKSSGYSEANLEERFEIFAGLRAALTAAPAQRVDNQSPLQMSDNAASASEIEINRPKYWDERIKEAHQKSDPENWPSSLKAEYMEAEILELRAALAAAPAQEELAAMQAGEYPAGTGSPEADRIICRLASSDPDFDDCADAVALIHKLVAEIKGPDGFATWKDAAIADRAARGQAPAAWAAPAGVLEDAARWHWMAEYIVGTRTDLDDELIASATVDELSKLVDAALAAAPAQPDTHMQESVFPRTNPRFCDYF